MSPEPRTATVVVIGAGQAGLSAAYHLHRRGFVSAVEHPEGERTFVVLDAEDRAGGAWQHRWQPVDTILWATGFSAALDHLAPLALESPLGGMARIGTQVASEPRGHLIGIGPSQSTVGANRAGRDAVLATARFLSATDAVAVPISVGRPPARTGSPPLATRAPP